MTISKPKASDLSGITALYRLVIDDMHYRDLYQWDWGRYPYEELIKEDIKLGRLFRIDDEDGLAGVFALQTDGKEAEYQHVDWQAGEHPVCLHRIAISPDRGGRGYARVAIDYAKAYGKSIGCDTFRVDTYDENHRAMKLFESVTEREAGTFTMDGFDKPFHCFECPL